MAVQITKLKQSQSDILIGEPRPCRHSRWK